jgi:hypothetical protein
MAIDPLHEDLITLDEARDVFPRSPSGKRPHVSRLYRYTVEGCRGVVLDWIQCGARRCTSKQAIARFFAALTAAVADRRTTANEKAVMTT